MHRLRFACLVLGLGGLWACGDSFSANGEAGSSGASDGGAGQAGAGGWAGAGGGAGKGGTSGSAGTAGIDGSSGGGAGTAGSSATGGSAGAAGGTGGGAGRAGASGAAGAAGSSPIACQNDTECMAAVPSTTPAWCAVPQCEPSTKVCTFVARDGDNDGHGAQQCMSNDPAKPVTTGDDCDDGDKDMFPGNWDGPAGNDHPQSRCDGKDQDCTGTADDAVSLDGAKCVCVPGELGKCYQDENGDFSPCPHDVKGECKCGDWTCQTGGSWGTCVGSIPPSKEQCTSALLDEDCDGDPSNGCECIQNDVADCSEMQDGTPIVWPTGAPKGICQVGKKTCQGGGTWGPCIGAIPPGTELCDEKGLDEDCDAQSNEGCACSGNAEAACGCTGTQACMGGIWGPCENDTPRIEVCQDSDRDGYCVMASCQSQCPGAPIGDGWELSSSCLVGNDCADSSAGISPGASETCGDQIDMNCDGNVSDGFDPEGQSCGVSSGCCLGTGMFRCNAQQTATYCDAAPSADPIDVYSTSKCSTGNQSFDWNCNGAADHQKVTQKLNPPEDQCLGKPIIDFACQDAEWLAKNLDPICADMKCGAGVLVPFQCACGKKADVCGKEYPQFRCSYDALAFRCVFAGVASTKYTMACK